MKLQDFYKLPHDRIEFNKDHAFFDEKWFPGILSLRFRTAELDEKALAQAGRFEAFLLGSHCDSYGEWSSGLIALHFDGKPVALLSYGGEHRDTDFLYVTDSAAYAAAQAHVEQHLKHREADIEVVGPDKEVSVHDLCGRHFPELAEKVIESVREVFGNDKADDMLGFDTLPVHGEWSILGIPPDDRVGHIIFVASDEVPPKYLAHGAAWMEKSGPYDSPSLDFFKKSVPEVKSYWLYVEMDGPPAKEETDVGRF